MDQTAIPVDVAPAEIARLRDLGEALVLSARVSGWADKEAQAVLGADKAQWSRWRSGQEGIKWERIKALQMRGNNRIPVMWMAHDSGFDLSSMRLQENELERDNRLLREENEALRRVLTGGRT